VICFGKRANVKIADATTDESKQSHFHVNPPLQIAEVEPTQKVKTSKDENNLKVKQNQR